MHPGADPGFWNGGTGRALKARVRTIGPAVSSQRTPPPQSTTPGLHPVSIHHIAPPERHLVNAIYPHISTNFRRFIPIFNKMALIFLGYLPFLPFQVSSFTKSGCLDFIANDEWPQYTQLQSTGLGLRFGAMLESYPKLQQKPKTVTEFKNAQVDLVCLT